MKKSMYREMYNMPPLEEKPKKEVEETEEVLEEKKIKKEVKKKNGRKFTI